MHTPQQQTAELAAHHARQAESLLDQRRKLTGAGKVVDVNAMTRAGVHATLAVYYQALAKQQS
jgi:hypothetical protein